MNAIHHAQQWKFLTVGVGAVASMALSQLPTAYADDFTDVFDNVQFATNQGQSQLATAAADFANSDPVHGLTMAISGIDNLGVAAQEDALVGTIDAFLGHTPYETFFGLFPGGLDLATAMTDAQGVISDGQTLFAQALADFGNADFVDGLELAVDASNAINVVAPDFLFLGFADSLLGL